MNLIEARELEDELEVMFIAETFHKSQPILEKAIQSTIPRVWIKDKAKKVKDLNGVLIKLEPQPRVAINTLFTELIKIREQYGVIFESDVIDDEEADDDDYEDIGDTTEELLLGSTKGMKRSTKNNIAINLAKKLKKRAIANRLGVAYNPTNSKLKNLRSRLGTTKSWSEKFGQLLAAKKLLYLPLLFRKYHMGPKRTREELDIEIDLYMAEVRRAKKLKLGFDQIKDAVNGTDEYNNGIKLVDPKEIFGGFGGPGWRKKVKAEKVDEPPPPSKDELDMDIDEYMASKDTPLMNGRVIMNGIDGKHSNYEEKEELDIDLDQYMAAVKKKK